MDHTFPAVDAQHPIQGSCACGAIRYSLPVFTRSVMTCHCVPCQKTSGHYVAAARGDLDTLCVDINEDCLRWYASGPGYWRGFCHTCGSSLFWHKAGTSHISIHAGTYDKVPDVKTEHHICLDQKQSYYDHPSYSEGKARG